MTLVGVPIRIETNTREDYLEILEALQTAVVDGLTIAVDLGSGHQSASGAEVLEAVLTPTTGSVSPSAIELLTQLLVGEAATRPESRIWIRETEEEFDEGALVRRFMQEFDIE